MAEDQARETVSREAHDRVTRERDELKAQLEKASAALSDMTLVDKTRSFLKGKVGDPDLAADFMLPHLRGTELDKLGETLSSERFTSMLSLMAQPTAPAPSGDPDEDTTPTPPPSQTGFSGPNPGATGGPSPTPEKVKPSALEGMSREQVAELDSKGMIDWSSKDGEPLSISSRFRG